MDQEAGSKGRVLFVDDEELLVDIATTVLNKMGYQVIAATSPQEALAGFSQNPEDFVLVITDLTMPEITGVELTREIKHHRPDLPVIACTGFMDQYSLDDLEEAGVDRILTKPISLKIMEKAVRDTIGRN